MFKFLDNLSYNLLKNYLPVFTMFLYESFKGCEAFIFIYSFGNAIVSNI